LFFNYSKVCRCGGIGRPACCRQARWDEKSIFMKKFYAYALYSDSYKRLYIGHSNDLQRRFDQHNKGRVNSTKPYIPYRLIHFEELKSKSSAVKREKKLKSSTGRRFLRSFI